VQTRNIQIPPDIINELNVPQIIDITDDLPKNPVKDWNALNPPRDVSKLTDNVYHHTAVPKYVGADAARHARNHINLKSNEPTGDGGFPYHFYIRYGQIYQCNDLRTFVYSVSRNNWQTINIAVEGLYSGPLPQYTGWDEEVADEDWRAMIALEITLRRMNPNYQRTNGHNFYQAKACPGYSMSKFREDVEDVQNRLAFKSSEQGMEERSFGIANYILYLYNLAKGKDWDGKPVGDGTKRWARARLLLLEDPVNELKKGG
jgi:hypothetical protein